MSSIVIKGNTSGQVEIAAPDVAGSTTLTMPTTDGTVITNNSAVSDLPKGPAFSAYLSADQSFSTSTNTKLQFNTEDFDTSSDYDNTTNYRYTPSVAGYYQVNTSARLNYSGAASDNVQLHIWKNGTSHTYTQYNNATGIYGSLNVSAIVYCNGSTDYIEVYAYSQHGSPFVDVKIGSFNSTARFNAALVSV